MQTVKFARQRAAQHHYGLFIRAVHPSKADTRKRLHWVVRAGAVV